MYAFTGQTRSPHTHTNTQTCDYLFCFAFQLHFPHSATAISWAADYGTSILNFKHQQEPMIASLFYGYDFFISLFCSRLEILEILFAIETWEKQRGTTEVHLDRSIKQSKHTNNDDQL